jgi:hypothetical protein
MVLCALHSFFEGTGMSSAQMSLQLGASGPGASGHQGLMMWVLT